MSIRKTIDPALRRLMPHDMKTARAAAATNLTKAGPNAEPGAVSDITFKPAELRFNRSSLEPHLSAEAMGFHYDKHYLGYLAKVNALVAGTELATMPLEDVIRQAAWKRKRPLLTNAAQTWNHAFFWESLSPDAGSGPTLTLAEAIAKTFGSVGKFKQKFVEKGLAHLGSGWLWLASHPEHGLMLRTTENATPIWLASGRVPLLVCDLWEHAYYLDWKNDRAGWLEAFITRLADWESASGQFAAAVNGTRTWRYPL